MTDKKRVFILGAGFSKQVDMPLATELTDLIFQKFRDDDAEDAIKWFDSLTQKIKKFSNSSKTNIEELFHYAQFDIELLKMEQQLRPVGRRDGITSWNHAEGIESWLQHMEEDLIDTILDKQKHAKPLELIDNFANSLTINDTIITFNYDTLVEDALAKRKVSWNHGLKDQKTGEIVILKMHGSIDWLILKRGETENHNKLRLLFRKQDMNQEHTTSQQSSGETEYDFELARIERTSLDNWIEGRILQSGPWKSVGVTGLGGYKPLHRLPGSGMVWARARGHLEHADEIIIVGFSFSPFDAMVRLCFCDVMADRKNPKVIAIDHKESDAEKNEYQKVVKAIFGENVDFRWNKAQDEKWIK
jgi:hypothetical protein